MKIFRILVIIGFAITLFTNLFHTDKRKYNANPYPSSLINDVFLHSYPSYKSANEKRVSVEVANANAGTQVQVLETDHSWAKIKLPSGEMGWTERTNLQLPTAALTRYHNDPGSGLYETPDYKEGKQIKRFKKRTYLQILEYKTVKPERGTETLYARAKAPDGTTGWIRSYNIELIGWEQPRLIKRNDWRYEKDPFIKKWNGKEFDKFEKKFSEPSATAIEDGKAIHYFNNIYLYDKDRVEMGMKITVEEGKIVDITRSHRITKWIGKFPLSTALRSSFIMNNFWNFFSFSELRSYDKYGDEVKGTNIKTGTWYWWILVIILGSTILSMFYVLVAAPYLIMDKVAYHFSLDKSKSNKLILMIASLGAIVSGYLYFVFLNTNFGAYNNWFLLHFLFSLGLLTGFISKWRGDLMYKRCQRCRFWSGTNDRSELIGATETTQTTTYSSGRKDVEKGTTEYWVDYQYCNRTECGYHWTIRRTVWSGWRRA